MNEANLTTGFGTLLGSIAIILFMPYKNDTFFIAGIACGIVGVICSIIVLYQEYSKYQKNKSQGL